MLVKPLLNHIFDDDALTRGLGDPEARVLIEWLVDQVEHLVKFLPTESEADATVRRLCRRGRAIGRFVTLWCYDHQPAAAFQLAATERFGWPLPTAFVEPDELMADIIAYEANNPTI